MSCDQVATRPSCVHDAMMLDGMPTFGRQATSWTVPRCCSSTRSCCFFQWSVFPSPCQMQMPPSAPAVTSRRVAWLAARFTAGPVARVAALVLGAQLSPTTPPSCAGKEVTCHCSPAGCTGLARISRRVRTVKTPRASRPPTASTSPYSGGQKATTLTEPVTLSWCTACHSPSFTSRQTMTWPSAAPEARVEAKRPCPQDRVSAGALCPRSSPWTSCFSAPQTRTTPSADAVATLRPR
mmetsp:Transcript_105789/g.341281  ORF Transcript_105789/g.341281 Transcript_105789/m.341281 type:complete len:238 (-) Transcript_105789:121-834(-)